MVETGLPEKKFPEKNLLLPLHAHKTGKDETIYERVEYKGYNLNTYKNPAVLFR